jgi:uncharacterized membrane protein YebE (DUF533 family)
MFGAGGGSSSTGGGAGSTDLLGGLAGSLFGGGSSSSGKGALGGSALALLGSLAMQALSKRSGAGSAMPFADPGMRLMAGLREPADDREQEELQSVSLLTIKAMLNAAKADGCIDEQELQRILGEASKDGLSAEEREFIEAEARKPLDTDAIVQAVPNLQVGAQIYAASLLAIEVDTDAERRYLEQLAAALGLDDEVVGELHSSLGVA